MNEIKGNYKPMIVIPYSRISSILAQEFRARPLPAVESPPRSDSSSAPHHRLVGGGKHEILHIPPASQGGSLAEFPLSGTGFLDRFVSLPHHLPARFCCDPDFRQG